MGLFSKLFGQKNKDITTADNTVRNTTVPNLELYENLVNRIVVSEKLKADLKIKIKQAFENPKSFYDDQNDFILSERGLSFPDDAFITPKFVLIDTLINNNQMAEVDWKEEEDEIRFVINRIVNEKKYGFKLSDQPIYDHNETFEIIELIDKEELKSLGYSLEMIDIDSDSYVFTIVPLAKQQEVSHFFAQLN